MNLSALLPHLQQFGIAGYWFILVISLLEALVFTGWIVPGTVFVVIAGGLAGSGIYDFWDLVFFATIGAVVGDGISFELGRKGKGIMDRWPFLKKHIEKATPFFLRHQGKSVAFGRFVGWIRPAVPFIAGVADMSRIRFYIVNVLSGFAWAVAYLGVGYVFGSAWQLALLWATRATILLLIIALLTAVTVWLWRWFLHHGNELLALLVAVWQAMQTTIAQYPPVQGWTGRHERFLTFIRNRFSRQSFFGLPFTIFVTAFLYTVSLLLGIVQDYLESDPLVAADKRIENLLFAFRNPELIHAFYFITLFAEAGVIIATALFLTLVLWRHRQRIFVLTLWLTLIGADVTAYIGKLLFHRQRPDEFIRAVIEDSFSFPSGHSTTAAAFYGFLAYFLVRTQRSWKIKVSAVFSVVVIVLLVNFSRLYLGVHYLSDVLAGDLVSLSFLIFAISVTEWLLWKQKEEIERPLPVRSFLVVGLAQFCIVVVLYAFAPAPWSTSGKPPKTLINAEDVLPLFERGTLPSYTETLIGSYEEPINLIALVPQDCLAPVMQKAGWIRAQSVSLRSVLATFRAILLNQPYPSAPMTPSFYNASPHDFGFEKATEQDSARERHHVRLWQTKYETAANVLFVGTASLDSGIKWGGITHAIDPGIDSERRLLVADLQRTGFVANVREMPFVQPTLGKNFTGDEFFTDGKAMLMTLKPCH